MYSLAVNLIMSVSGHSSIINEMLRSIKKRIRPKKDGIIKPFDLHIKMHLESCQIKRRYAAFRLFITGLILKILKMFRCYLNLNAISWIVSWFNYVI